MYSGLFDERIRRELTRVHAGGIANLDLAEIAPRVTRVRTEDKPHVSSTRNARLTVIMSSVGRIGRERSGDSRANSLPTILTILGVPTIAIAYRDAIIHGR